MANAEFEVWLSPDDLASIRDAVRRWGKPDAVADAYDGALLHRHIDMWRSVVDTDWSKWDIAEYDHDIGCRTWVQVAVENGSADAAERILHAVEPSDRLFRSRMVPAARLSARGTPVLSHNPYFWESHTIHPELAAH